MIVLQEFEIVNTVGAVIGAPYVLSLRSLNLGKFFEVALVVNFLQPI